jgi:hypothetical protein
VKVDVRQKPTYILSSTQPKIEGEDQKTLIRKRNTKRKEIENERRNENEKLKKERGAKERET